MRTGLGSLIALIFVFTIFSTAHSLYPQKEQYGVILLETGSGTKDIMPLLRNIASTYDGFFNQIYGQYRRGYVLLICDSKGNLRSVQELDNLGKNVVRMIRATYPESEGRVQFKHASTDFWDSFQVEFNKIGLINTELSPNAERIQTRLLLQSYRPFQKMNESANICDLDEGMVFALNVGDLKNASEVIDAIGKSPSSVTFWLTFADNGLEVVLEQMDIEKKSRILELKIWYSAEDPWGQYNTKFEGYYFPNLKNDETKESILEKFGTPSKMGTTLLGNDFFSYKKKYGILTFYFVDKLKLNIISMRLDRGTPDIRKAVSERDNY